MRRLRPLHTLSYVQSSVGGRWIYLSQQRRRRLPPCPLERSLGGYRSRSMPSPRPQHGAPTPPNSHQTPVLASKRAPIHHFFTQNDPFCALRRPISSENRWVSMRFCSNLTRDHRPELEAVHGPLIEVDRRLPRSGFVYRCRKSLTCNSFCQWCPRPSPIKVTGALDRRSDRRSESQVRSTRGQGLTGLVTGLVD